MRSPLLFAALLLSSAGAFAASASLLQASDYVPDSSATAPEAARLATARAARATVLSARLVKVNASALGAGAISVTLPDGTTREFTGTLTRQKAPRDATNDHFASKEDAQAAIAKEPARPELLTWIGNQVKGPASAQFYTDGTAFGGWVSTESRMFNFGGTVGGRILMTEPVPLVVNPTKPDFGPPTQPPPASRSTIQRMTPQAAGNPYLNIMVVWSPLARQQSAACCSTDWTYLSTQIVSEINGIWNKINTAGGPHVAMNATMIVSASSVSPGLDDNDPVKVVAAAKRDPSLLRIHDQQSADVVIIVNGISAADSGQGYAAENPASARSAFMVISHAGTVNNRAPSGYVAAHTLGHLLGAHHQTAGGNPPSTNDSAGTEHGYIARLHPVGSAQWLCYHTLDAFPRVPVFGEVCDANSTNGLPFDFYQPVYSAAVPVQNGYLPLSGGLCGATCPIGDSSGHNNIFWLNYWGPIATGWRNTVLAQTVEGGAATPAVTYLASN